MTFTLPDSNHGMKKVKCSVENGRCVTSNVPLSSIQHSAHLFPRFNQEVLCQEIGLVALMFFFELLFPYASLAISFYVFLY